MKKIKIDKKIDEAFEKHPKAVTYVASLSVLSIPDSVATVSFSAIFSASCIVDSTVSNIPDASVISTVSV